MAVFNETIGFTCDSTNLLITIHITITKNNILNRAFSIGTTEKTLACHLGLIDNHAADGMVTTIECAIEH